MIKCCIFDLDGTLIDSLADLGETVNQLLKEQKQNSYSIEAYRMMVGDGVKMLLKRAFPQANEAELCALKKRFDRLYRANCFQNTLPYPGICEVLNHLQKQHIQLAVLSNKPDSFAKEICSHFFGDELFFAVTGQKDNQPKKPSPEGAEEIIRRCGCTKEQVLFIGDSNVDIFTAQNAGIASCGVLWGFRSEEELIAAGADFLISHPRELTTLLSK